MEIVNAIVSFIDIWGALIIAGLSLVVAVISLMKSSGAQNLQTKVNELELRIKQYELKRIQEKQAASNKACIEARVISVGTGKHRLKVWNSGDATAYNVVAKFEEGSNIVIMDREKMPFDELEQNKSFEIVLITHGGSATKFKIFTEWTDLNGNAHTKTQMGDL